MWEKVEEMIEKSVEAELRYGKDKYDSKQWRFIEEEAPKICLKNIREDYEESEIENITQKDVDGYFDSVVNRHMN